MKFFLITFFSLSVFFVNAQNGSIKGTVKDQDNQPLIGATITLNQDRGTLVDVDGNFKFSNLGEGSYNLEVSFLGFESQTKKINLKEGEIFAIDFTLEESEESLQEVEIIGRKARTYKNSTTFAATKTATKIKDVPQAVSYVTKEVIADQQAYRVNDIIKNISGVNTFSYYDDFSMRGFRSGDTYINGLRVVGLFGPQPLLANIERVEVIKGPASAMFGNSVPGGVMNRVTKKPLREDRKSINFTLGSFNTLRTTADFTGAINESETLVYRLNLAY
ncbi:carboxypeptidase-like regulatory domain-containing protein [Psychroflexus tropicus]|uniref:carboxypeptidase-like regulatory domain-containing protein n=1 Tax=Psychroflexus tropicus TaxID=197345 RepID=UPI000372F3C7|nr:carboxypeptidase-like regulatory domain-containing protein [Psychroflexus tropicus]